MTQLSTDEASNDIDPEGPMVWQESVQYSNFCIAYDNVFVHVTTADRVVADTQTISGGVLEVHACWAGGAFAEKENL